MAYDPQTKLYFKCLGDNSLQYLSSWYNMCCACISKWLYFNFWFTFGDFRSSNERRFDNAFGCCLFAILDFRFDKWSLCFAKVSFWNLIWGPYIVILRACSIIGSVCLVICETLQTGRSLFAGLPELHDKMNGFFSKINFKKKIPGCIHG